jgi:ribosomal protein S18 acetylase RimI-like enzyme
MEIRSFQPEDEPGVIAIWQEVFAYPTQHNNPAFTIGLKLRAQPQLFFVAVEEEKVIGTVMGGYDGHRGWIYLLAVAPGSRRRGAGSALVRHVEAALRTLGCPKINLQVLAENSQVVRFYEKLGFRVEERISMGKVM